MNLGWISLYRQIQNHWLWEDKPFSQGQAWIDLLLLANHDATKFPMGNEIITAAAGTVITSELKLMDRWGWSKTKVRRFLNLLISDGMITKKTDRKKTTITIVKWGVFQNSETTEKPIKDHSKTNRRPIEDTNNNVNNDNNENNILVRSSTGAKRKTKPTLEEIKEYCSEQGINIDCEKFYFYYERNGWTTGKSNKPIKSWKASVQLWARNKDNQRSVDVYSTRHESRDESLKYSQRDVYTD